MNIMNTKLIEQITTMINTLNSLNIKNNSEDDQQVNTIILYANAMKQILNEGATINMDKFNSMLSKRQEEANSLITKWNK